MTHAIKRRLTQAAFALALNVRFGFLLPAGFINAVDKMRHFCVPALNCWSCPLATFSCPIGALGTSLSSRVVPLVVIGGLLVAGAVLGSIFCGWVCPFGLLQELLSKIPTPKFRIPDYLTKTKYFVLAGSVIIVPYLWTTSSNFFFCQYCPAGRIEAGLYEKTVSPAVPQLWRLTVLVAFVLLIMFSYRGFCRAVCPLGAIFGLCNKFSLFRMRLDRDKCTNCKWCHKVCPVSHRFNESDNSANCVRCLNCEECKFGAVSSGFTKAARQG